MIPCFKADYYIHLGKKLPKLHFTTLLELTISKNCVWLETKIDLFIKITLFKEKLQIFLHEVIRKLMAVVCWQQYSRNEECKILTINMDVPKKSVSHKVLFKSEDACVLPLHKFKGKECNWKSRISQTYKGKGWLSSRSLLYSNT